MSLTRRAFTSIFTALPLWNLFRAWRKLREPPPDVASKQIPLSDFWRDPVHTERGRIIGALLRGPRGGIVQEEHFPSGMSRITYRWFLAGLNQGKSIEFIYEKSA